MRLESLSSDYKILSWNEAFETVFENGMEFHRPSKILKIEGIVEIYLYCFDSGNCLVLPCQPVSGFSRNEYPAFLYTNKINFEKAVEAKQFPVPEKFITLLEREKGSLKKIEQTYPDYLSFFDTVMKTSFSKEITIDTLTLVHPRIKTKKSKPQFDKLLLAYSILINRFLMQERNASSFLVTKNQGYYPFYVPCVQIGGSTVNTYENIGWDELKGSFINCLTSILFSARPLLPEFQIDDGLEFIRYMMERRK